MATLSPTSPERPWSPLCGRNSDRSCSREGQPPDEEEFILRGPAGASRTRRCEDDSPTDLRPGERRCGSTPLSLIGLAGAATVLVLVVAVGRTWFHSPLRISAASEGSAVTSLTQDNAFEYEVSDPSWSSMAPPAPQYTEVYDASAAHSSSDALAAGYGVGTGSAAPAPAYAAGSASASTSAVPSSGDTYTWPETGNTGVASVGLPGPAPAPSLWPTSVPDAGSAAMSNDGWAPADGGTAYMSNGVTGALDAIGAVVKGQWAKASIITWTSVTTSTTTSTTLLRCGLVEENTEYPGNDLATLLNVFSAEACCQACAMDLNCVAWTWGKERGHNFTDTCLLKGGHPRGMLTKVTNVQFTSGMPSQVNRSIPTMRRKLGQSLYCFCLMLPYGYEPGLVAMQYHDGLSIFGCDEYDVYSNETLTVAPGVVSVSVSSSLHCDKGGEFKTALNTDIFLAVWKELIRGGRHQFHDWTVKVDPDCVFFPARLRANLVRHTDSTGEGVYLNNCKRGMHGPLEILSRNAVSAWGKGQARCTEHFTKLCSGPCLWGEDMFMDQCLQKVLKIERDYDEELLVEDHCDPPPDWQTCQQSTIVAFHPFKEATAYQGCTRNASSGLM